jgi:hypothetical protein
VVALCEQFLEATRFRQGTFWGRSLCFGQREETWPVRFVPPARLDWICRSTLITLAAALMKREGLVGRVSVGGVGRASDGGVYRKSQARPAATSRESKSV